MTIFLGFLAKYLGSLAGATVVLVGLGPET